MKCESKYKPSCRESVWPKPTKAEKLAVATPEQCKRASDLKTWKTAQWSWNSFAHPQVYDSLAHLHSHCSGVPMASSFAYASELTWLCHNWEIWQAGLYFTLTCESKVLQNITMNLCMRGHCMFVFVWVVTQQQW